MAWIPDLSGDPAHRLAPRMSQLSGPAGLEVPVCTFEGHVRTPAIEAPLIYAVFGAAFPAFEAGADHYRNVDLFSGRYRRFAGSAATLGAGSYFSVARWDGRDVGGLIREIFAYANPEETGIVMLDDMSDPGDVPGVNRKYGTQFEPGEYLLLFVAEPKRLIPDDWQSRSLTPAGTLAQFFSVPCPTKPMRIEQVVDLRLPAAQEWFFKTFTNEEWLNIHVPLPPIGSFLEMLPFLLGQYRGGNALTQAVGRELRLMGAGGLVYPSARCNASVIVSDGHIVDWYGWNLVDYSTTRADQGGFHPLDAMLVTSMGESKDFEHGARFFGLPWGQMKVNSARVGPEQGTWQVVGLEDLNVSTWLSKLTPEQHQFLGLPPDAAHLKRSDAGLHEVERLLQQRYRELAEKGATLPLSLGRVRELLGALAMVFVDVPGRHLAAINGDTMDKKIKLGGERAAFEEVATGTGMLVEEVKGYFKFSSKEAFEYFTTVG